MTIDKTTDMKIFNATILRDHSPPIRKLPEISLLKTVFMKQLQMLVAVLIFTFNTYGQLTKSTWLLGGSGSMYSYNEDYTAQSVNVTAKYTSIDLSSSIGYFFFDKFSGGLRPYFSSYKGESSGGGTTNSYRLAIGPFVRYYFLDADKPFNILSDVSYQIGLNKDLGALGQKGKFNTFSILGGTEVFFNSTAGLEILIGYRNQVASLNSSSGYNSKKKGFQASIGFTLHLEKK